MGIYFILLHSSSCCFPSYKVSATALMHSLTNPPSVNGFLCWPKIQATGNIHGHIVGQWMSRWRSWWTDHTGLSDGLFSETLVQILREGLVEIFVFCVIVALHIATFNERYGLWAYQTQWFCTAGGKNEQKWVCPFRIESSILAINFSSLRWHHFFFFLSSPTHSSNRLSLSLLTCLIVCFSTCFQSSVSLSLPTLSVLLNCSFCLSVLISSVLLTLLTVPLFTTETWLAE